MKIEEAPERESPSFVAAAFQLDSSIVIRTGYLVCQGPERRDYFEGLGLMCPYSYLFADESGVMIMDL